MLTRWFYERCMLSSKHIDPLTVKVEKKIDRRIVKAKGFQVYKYELGKIPCRHAIPAIYSRGVEVHRFTDGVYTTAMWRTAYAESINPIAVPEAEWNVPTELNLRRSYQQRQERVLVDQ
ncbi:hypothetical protein F2Q69_00007262 [Brassica cretica]|uniref:Zinc finger PMZ-type domain-containing protein n=1 Tax=Brassica cretica TaxID=69181 RepID=A0A8S9PME7_BRACR|nr:hypothetical protein F2Q69_00007262 [Brassica cretica]